MSKNIVLLSGKGGSGKTTFSLSMASLIVECGLKVLLIDCDLSTNGATYFFQEQLIENKAKLISLTDIILEKGADSSERKDLVHIYGSFDFMPSKINLSSNKTEIGINDNAMLTLEYYMSGYDVVLFDCQAGYTLLLEDLMKRADVAIAVLEPDAISSAALTNLCVKLGNTINSDCCTYQVFNKATTEEREIYSKLTGGTIYTNLETVVFDWKIRKAFGLAQIPDSKNCSKEYLNQIFYICKNVLKDNKYKNKLRIYELNLKKEQNLAEKKKWLDSIREGASEKKDVIKRDRFLDGLLLAFGLMSFIFTFYSVRQLNILKYDLKFVLVLIEVTIVLLTLLGIVLRKFIKKTDNDILLNDMKDNVKKCDELEKDIEKELAEIMNIDYQEK